MSVVNTPSKSIEKKNKKNNLKKKLKKFKKKVSKNFEICSNRKKRQIFLLIFYLENVIEKNLSFHF